MAGMDRFIEALFEAGAQRLTLASGQPVMLLSGGEATPLTTTAPTPEQLEALLVEVLPEGDRDPAAPGRYEFTYRSPAGSVEVRAYRTDSGVRVLVVPGEDELDGPAPAAEDGEGGAEPAGTPTIRAPAAPASPSHAAPPASAVETSPADLPSDAPLMERLFRRMVREGCSDLHVSAGNTPLFRKDGEMVDVGGEDTLSPERTREVLLEIAPARNREEFEQRHDTDFAYEIPGVARFRCNLFLDRRGIGGVFRQIPSEILTAEQLGLPRAVLELCGLGKGLVVVTGPTGSGKSTTLAAMIDYINERRRDHVITIEDPIEFVHENKRCLINQREVGTHTAGFKAALRAALREDPDIVLVGEMRDLETVEIALETAETGHLVFGTLHTNTAASTVDRIIDQFPADQQNQIRTMLAESLKGVVAQTLCRRKTGGRVAALEVLLVSSAVSNLIREGKTFQIPSIMQTSKGAGMTTLNDALLGLIREGTVQAEEAYRKAVAKGEFSTLLERNGFSLSEDTAG
ncbi:MAG: type IV pilus twitching motility protein PilT [Candidatus Palauibacterales bacterium]|nr:type IV pilus twitching motility protein PilT [Candidatus Palauibacterales bacterium]MDP2582569.1 type IV pilus twitching motility protein PilT [Candidatus Palauibacterales bacterium]